MTKDILDQKLSSQIIILTSTTKLYDFYDENINYKKISSERLN